MKWPDFRHLEGYLSPDMEKAYRLSYLKDDVRSASITMLVVCILLVAFAYNDYALFGFTPVFFFLAAMRVAFLAYFIILIIVLRKIQDPARFDLQLFIWLLVSMALVILINLSRPASYAGNFVLDAILILLVYLGIPMRLLFRCIGIFIFTIAEILIFLLIRQVSSPVAAYASLLALITANFGGIFASATLYSYRRREYSARIKQEQLAKQWQDTFDAINDPVSIQDTDFHLVRVNRAYAEFMNSAPAQLIGKHCYEVFHGTTCPIDNCPHETTMKTGKAVTEEVYEPRFGVFLEISTSPIFDENKKMTGTVHLAKDITNRKQSDLELQKSRDLLNDMGKAAHVGGWEFDPLTRLQTWTEEVYRIHELEHGRQPTVDEGISYYPDEARKLMSEAVQQAIDLGRPFDLELPFVTARGNRRWVHAIGNADRQEGRTVRVWGTFQDITERRQMQAQMEEIATHDFLTGLPNRLLLYDRFEIAASQAARNKGQLALLSLDLDHFKLINDSLGHTAGDEVLKHFASRLTGLMRASDTVARIGGDEFLVLLQDVRQRQDIVAACVKILDSFSEPFKVDGHVLKTSTSIGIAVYPADGKDLESLMKSSDEALYQAKGAGRNNYQFQISN
jgi:diguanylate cyclase (GGDEF)-like protein/PAS domain S-box-containing protein